MSPEPDQHSVKNGALRPASQSSQNVSFRWDELDQSTTKQESSTTMQFSLAECVETKTVTTTTTTKRSFPPIYVRAARPLNALDQKEYPLAHKPTPKEISHLSWDFSRYNRPHSDVSGDAVKEGDSFLTEKCLDGGNVKAELVGMTPQDSPIRPVRKAASFRARIQKQRPARPNHISLPHAVADRLRHDAGRAALDTPATPDTSDMSLARVSNDTHDCFSPDVPTPPVERYAEPFSSDESSQESLLHQASVVSTVAAQSDALPSPGLSPTLAATEMTGEVVPWDGTQGDGSQRCLVPQPSGGVQLMLQQFDQMPDELQSFMIYQMLRRCPRKTLHMVANVVNPALKCDFIRELPNELSLMILTYLDYRDLCHAAQVSKYWRNIVDTNESGWKELLDRDGLELPPREVEKAITQGWGWQDPVGYYSGERDLSAASRKLVDEQPVNRKPGPFLRSSVRKRALATASYSERSKRRASGHDKPSAAASQARQRSEGPIAHATAAALAVPDPGLGLPSLRKLHLYKSLYRRQHMIRSSWTKPGFKPSHVAFAAHPRHVITCLQFDEDKIITGSDDTFIHVYDTKTGELRKKLSGHEGGVWALQYVGITLVSGSTDRSVRVWDIETGQCTHVFWGHTSTVRCLQILMPTEVQESGRTVMMPSKPLIITGSRDSQLRVWQLPEPGSRKYVPAHPPASDNECHYFIRALVGHLHSVRAIAAHGDTLVSGSYDSTVRVWKISTGENVHVLTGHTQKVYSVVLDLKRNRCISGSMDSFVRIWDLSTGHCLHLLEGHTLLVGLLDLEDERLVSAAADSTLRVWDPENGRCKQILTAHTGAITCFQHDARKVISGSEKTVKIWDIVTGECIQNLLTDLTGVWQVSFDRRRCVAAVQRDQITYLEVSCFSLGGLTGKLCRLICKIRLDS